MPQRRGVQVEHSCFISPQGDSHEDSHEACRACPCSVACRFCRPRRPWQGEEAWSLLQKGMSGHLNEIAGILIFAFSHSHCRQPIA